MIDHAEDIERLLESARPRPMAVDADLALETGRRRVRSRRMTIAGAALALAILGAGTVHVVASTSDRTNAPAQQTNSVVTPQYSAAPGSIFQRSGAMSRLPYDQVVIPGAPSNEYQIDGTLRRPTVTALRGVQRVPLPVDWSPDSRLFTARDGDTQLILIPVPATTTYCHLVSGPPAPSTPQSGQGEVGNGVPLAAGGLLAVGSASANTTVTGAWWRTTAGSFGATRGAVGTVQVDGVTAFVFPGLRAWGLVSEMGLGWQPTSDEAFDTGGGDGGGLPRTYARLLPAAATSVEVTTSPSIRDAHVAVEKVAGTPYQLVLVTSPTTRLTTKLVTTVSWVDAAGQPQHVRG